MIMTGKYCFTQDSYDIDFIIDESVTKTKEFAITLTNTAKSNEDAKKILLAISTTLIEELAKI